MAAAANQPLIVEDLLNLGAEPNATDHRGRSVLHVAATYGLPRVLLVCLFGRWDEWDGLDCLDPEFQGYMAWRDSKPALCLLLQAVINSGKYRAGHPCSWQEEVRLLWKMAWPALM